MAWMKATPMTPWATARMVAVEGFANSAPRSGPMMRTKIAWLPRARAWPWAITMPATMTAARNISNSPPMPATTPTAVFARSPIFGCMLCTRPGRSSYARDHRACSLSPITGQPATPSRRAGIRRELICTSWISRCTESPSELVSSAVGATICTMASSTRTVAASPCRPPILRASDWWIG